MMCFDPATGKNPQWNEYVCQGKIAWGVPFSLNSEGIRPLSGHYGEEGQLQLSSMWLSYTRLCLQNMTIQACGSYRTRCILRVYFFVHFPPPSKGSGCFHFPIWQQKGPTCELKCPWKHCSVWLMPCWSTPHAHRGYTQIHFSSNREKK